MTVNLPYSKLAFVGGDPIHVPRDADAETLETLRKQLETQLNAATVRAYELAGADIKRATPLDHLAAISPPPPNAYLKIYTATQQARASGQRGRGAARRTSRICRPPAPRWQTDLGTRGQRWRDPMCC